MLLRDKDVACYGLLTLGAALLIGGFLLALYFSIKDPDQLRTEEFHLRHKAMEITEAKAKKFEASADDLVAMLNPYPGPKQLPPKRDREVDDSEYTDEVDGDGT